MKFEKKITKGCCGKSKMAYLLDKPFSAEMAKVSETKGFSLNERFFKSGIAYIEAVSFTATCPIGSNWLEISFKTKDSESELNNLEYYLSNL
mgnify:CR=1 FL=1